MSGLISKPPAPKPTPPAPERSSAEVASAAAEQRNRFYGAQSGRVSTMLSPFGSTGNATGSVVNLLGKVGA